MSLRQRLFAPLRGLAAQQEFREVSIFAEELLASTRLPSAGAAAVRRRQQERLQTVLRAAQRTKLYADVITDDIVARGALDEIPPVTKQDFLDRLDDTIVDGVIRGDTLTGFVRAPDRIGTLLQDRFLVAMTSGTTGQVGIFVNDVEGWARTRGVTFARIFRDALDAKEIRRTLLRGRTRLAFVVATGGHYMTALLATRVPPLGRLVVDSQTVSVEMPLPSLVSQLNSQRPHVLHSYPSLLELLANEKKLGRLKIDPEIITSGSERLTETARRSIADAFSHARLVETYAATECVQLGSSCSHGTLHLNDDACIVEPVDENDVPVSPGIVSAKVFVTNLLNVTQPLVRYVLTDQMEVLVDGCACGSPLTAMRVHGRTDDTFFLRDEEGAYQAHPPIPLELIFLSVSGLLQYQLVHEVQNTLRVLFVVDKTAAAAQVAAHLDDKFVRYLAEHHLLETVQFSLEQVARIERPARGKKIRQILSRVPPPLSGVRAASEVRERRHQPRTDP